MTTRCLPARACLSAVLLFAACGDDDTPRPAPDEMPDGATLQIKTLSNRADLISGGNALVEIVIPADAALDKLRVIAGARDVTQAFARRGDGRITGVIRELPVGETSITADVDGRGRARLVITNHPIGGPVISGPQIKPWVCARPVPSGPSGDTPAVSASGLSGEPDEQCNAPAEVKLYYRTTVTAGTAADNCRINALPDPPPSNTPAPLSCFKPFDPSAPLPTDLRMIASWRNPGTMIPFVVRVERGTLNRGIYDIAALVDPAQTTWDPAAPPALWNGKLHYMFGQSTGQPRRQQRSSQPWTAQAAALEGGYLVAMNNLTDSALNSNRVSMTETLMMMKEHIIESYGELTYTVGFGCSGGSINQMTAASIFPGLLDGAQVACIYPDSESTAIEVADCELLVRAYTTPEWRAVSPTTVPEQNALQGKINGHADHRGCRAWFNLFIGVGRPGNYVPEVVDADAGAITAPGALTNNCTLPASLVYDATTNPGGARCTGQDHAVSIWGTVAGTNRAPSTRDNVGVVYGYKAFLAGEITAEQLVVLNEQVGGSDFDIRPTAARSTADVPALEIAYRTGIVSDGRQLAKTPVIDMRGFDEFSIHHTWRSFALRARLDADAGGHANHAMWRYPSTLVPPASMIAESLRTMDQWLMALRSNTSGTREQRVIASKPEAAADFCYLTGDLSTKVRDMARCDADAGLKPHTSPRQVAGGPIAENILKCQLKPLVAADFPGVSDALFARLAVVFPDGVCDWTKPGVGQQPAVSPLDFTSGPGGTPLGAAPTSSAF